ncbi:carbohydrate esterase family 1 protein [Amniculicola lignicola CBS 123094]|uniref:feruloyl esterase n=1 Tax=Amniculicola lignicola CBS 123094 TaxID=1392246 RepID=A0A6A5WUH4_9PLEO|nr:carbohydrate esterase family 1 protein [Amniculicola lignicola CBS 123094]
MGVDTPEPCVTRDPNAAPAASKQKLSSGCGKAIPDGIELGKSKNQTISSKNGASPRKYRIHVPDSYKTDVPVPLILSFHGRDKDMKFQEKLSMFSNASYGFEGISVYPEGVPSKKGTFQWQGDPAAPSSINDIKFTLDLLDSLSESYCIDTNRIYAAGKSNGGGFTNLLACDSEASARIAAFAPVSGANYLNADGSSPPCTPSKSRPKIPILDFHGWIDNKIQYLGGLNDRENGMTVSILGWVDGWAEYNGYTVGSNKTTHLCGDDRVVTRYSWDDTIIHYNVSNLKHDWPSPFKNVDKGNLTCIDATEIILGWFKNWSL